ncbi:helix-turn-helix domain-containing protein [Deinococcus yavapaiensis]|uniref:Excisionase family DNA binding protein n=1 Tax=Deinococcus yavapaiensis KR-236 TaxID=694435 RepID=A0A318S3N0_9DEIO|nr:helix-turn-helix domain-containing protein [Deinococcus yavapaiensis]PYE52992.1 excisionase family DNA binding protein [Deinococcus yavapaiensis KR-236]
MIDPTKTYLTVAGVAKMLSVHENTVYRWIRAGRLRSYYVGASVRVSQTQLDEFCKLRTRRNARRRRS